MRPAAAIFPLLAIIFLTSTFVCVYIIAVTKGDVDPIWPYISDCAALYPESSIFAQLLDVTAFLIVWTAYIRNRRIQKVIEDATAADADDAPAAASVVRRRIQIASYVEFTCALIAVFGLEMVGNFQEFRRYDIHYVATLLMASGVGLYTLIDALITFVLRRTASYSKKTIVIFRAVVVLFMWIVASISIAGREVSGNQWKAHFPNQTAPERFNAQLHWSKTDPAYQWHLASTVCEWLAGLMLLFYLGSFVEEFIEFSASLQIIVHRPIIPSAEPDTATSSDQASPAEISHADASGSAAPDAGCDVVIGPAIMPT